MSNSENKRDDDRDPLDPSALVPSEIPTGLDRRKFIMRSAVISAAAVMNGCTRSETEQKAPPPAAEAPPAAACARGPVGCRPERGDEGKGAGVDDRGRVLQGGPGPVQLAHDWSDAHHLRFLPARHQTAGRQTRQGDEASGELVRQPQRDGQGTRHGTRRARRAGRERTGYGRPEIPRRLARQA